MKAFISYSSEDKLIAGRVKAILEDHNINAFLAHEDIHVSQEWKTRILEELVDTNIFIPLLSKAFKSSEWAPQEIGIAITRRNDVLFIPLSIDGTVPFGFISHIQGKPIPPNGNLSSLLIEPIIDCFPHDIIPTLISHLAGARSFRRAEELMLPLVHHFEKFNDDEISTFASESIDNIQIWDAADCRMEYLPAFLELHRTRIATDKRAALEYQLEHGQWYHLRNKEENTRRDMIDEEPSI